MEEEEVMEIALPKVQEAEEVQILLAVTRREQLRGLEEPEEQRRQVPMAPIHRDSMVADLLPEPVETEKILLLILRELQVQEALLPELRVLDLTRAAAVHSAIIQEVGQQLAVGRA